MHAQPTMEQAAELVGFRAGKNVTVQQLGDQNIVGLQVAPHKKTT
jgi:hypothetical protein